MPKGMRFCPVERQIVARAYRIATENSIRGADQKLSSFEADVYRNVKKHMPPGIHPGQYCERSPSNLVRFTKTSILNDIQKFGISLRLIKAAQPTGNVSETDIHCMAIANHLHKCTGINYSYATFGKQKFDPITTWDNYLAWLELKDCPKFQQSPSTTINNTHALKMNSSFNVTGIHDDTIDIEYDNDDNTTIANYKYGDEVESIPSFASSAKKGDATRSCYGIKKAKLDLKNQHRDAEALKNLNNVKNEVNALNATHQEMLAMMKSSMKKQEDMEILKLLKIKYKAIRNVDKDQADLLKIKISKKTDDILKYYENDDNENNSDTPLLTKGIVYNDDNILSIIPNNITTPIIKKNDNVNIVDLCQHNNYNMENNNKENVTDIIYNNYNSNIVNVNDVNNTIIINDNSNNSNNVSAIINKNNNNDNNINIINENNINIINDNNNNAIDIYHKEVGVTNNIIRELKRRLHESNNNIELLTNNINH
jgi:hypothetical protein